MEGCARYFIDSVSILYRAHPSTFLFFFPSFFLPTHCGCRGYSCTYHAQWQTLTRRRTPVDEGTPHGRTIGLRLKCDGTRAETRFCLSAKRTSPFKSSGASVLSTTGSRGVRISGSNAGYTMFRGSVKGTGYPLHSPVSPSLPLLVRHRVPSHFNWTLPVITHSRLGYVEVLTVWPSVIES